MDDIALFVTAIILFYISFKLVYVQNKKLGVIILLVVPLGLVLRYLGIIQFKNNKPDSLIREFFAFIIVRTVALFTCLPPLCNPPE